MPPPVTEALGEGEQVVWLGQPVPGAYVFGGLVVTAPLGVIAIASALTWTSGVDLSRPPPTWVLVVLGVVMLFAAHMLLIRPLLGWYLARRSYYVVTDQRSLVVCDAWSGRLQQLAHGTGRLLVVRGPRNFGKIQFGRTASSSMDVLLMGRAAIPGFYGLKDLDEALEALSGLRADVGDALKKRSL